MRGIQLLRAEAGGADFRDDLPVPEPGPGEVRVRVASAAICGTDRHIVHWDDSVSHLLTPPVVLGHEFCGHVDALGDGVPGWESGDFVSAEMHLTCNRCRACKVGNAHVCEETRIVGLQADGAFAEFLVIPARNLVRLDPDVVKPHIGSFLDALGNAVHTVQSASSIAGRHVMMSGYGAIGAMAASVVEFEGAKSLTITEVGEEHLARARAWADGLSGRVPVTVCDPTQEDDLATKIRDETGGGVDVVLEMSGAPPAIDLGLEVLYQGGEMMMLGIGKEADLTIRDFSRRIIFKGLCLRGILGRRIFATWDEMLGLLARGLDLEHIVTHRLPLSAFQEGIDLLDAGRAHKVVLDPAS